MLPSDDELEFVVWLVDNSVIIDIDFGLVLLFLCCFFAVVFFFFFFLDDEADVDAVSLLLKLRCDEDDLMCRSDFDRFFFLDDFFFFFFLEVCFCFFLFRWRCSYSCITYTPCLIRSRS